MSTEPTTPAAQPAPPDPAGQAESAQAIPKPRPEQAEPALSPEELRLMADTMPGDGPGD